MRKPSIWFWVIGVMLLIWNAFGCYMYVVDKTVSDERYAELYGAAVAATRDVYPAWATAGYAVGVWGALLATVLLLLRKTLAAPLYVLSLLGAVASFLPVFMDDAFKTAFGPTYWVMPVVVVVLGLFEIWWARRKSADGTLS